jgi:predicted nucleic acid-binding Zn ribbon protein
MRSPQALGKVIAEALTHYGLATKARNYEVLTHWDEIVGEQVAQSTHAEKLDRGVLTVKVANSVWRYELTLRSKEILKKIASACGDDIVKEIRWKL